MADVRSAQATGLHGLLGITAILKHAYRHRRFDLVHLETEGSQAGFWGQPSPPCDTVTDVCRGKTFLNFDDAAFGPGLHRYLAQQFPAPSRYERPDSPPAPSPPAS